MNAIDSATDRIAALFADPDSLRAVAWRLMDIADANERAAAYKELEEV